MADGEQIIHIGVTGHQHIPEAARVFVERGLREFLAQYDGRPVVGLSSLAVGADQLFAAEILRTGHTLKAILPSRRYERTFDKDGLKSFEALVGKARQVVTLGYAEPCEDAYLLAGKRVVDDCDLLVAFWDGQPADGKGGTADAVAYAREIGRPITVIWPEGVRH
ncbi:hypothetical protein [Bifidobacterium callimiconis]|nr:hypothetical protein [Bifidobacterium callimiconis]MBT1177273.1 hypothetical protein [Bifidobacterium callimiconis]